MSRQASVTSGLTAAPVERHERTADDTSMWSGFLDEEEGPHTTYQQLESAAVLSQQQVEEEIASAVASILGRRIESGAALMASGLDSLGSVELQNVLQGSFNVALPATMALDYPSISAMASFVHGRLSAAAAAASQRAAASPGFRRAQAVAPSARRTAPLAVGLCGMAFQPPGLDDYSFMKPTLLQGVDAVQSVPVDR